jgi:ribonuclease HI
MAKKKYYAVKAGKKPGIYMTWDDCKKQVHGFPGAIYKSFETESAAIGFLGISTTTPPHTISNEIYAFVDGSFNISTKVYGYGGFLVHNGQKEVLQGCGNDNEMASMRNVAGEILGSQTAIKKAIELGLPSIVVYYDYMGIECWANGTWKRNKTGTIQYHKFIQEAKKKIQIEFRKVKGHSGVEGNEEADRLAKEAVGIE